MSTRLPARRYTRALSSRFVDLLCPDGPLHPLVSFLGDRIGRKDGKSVDVHFRERDKLMFYVGLTRPLVLTLSGNGRHITASADKFYREVDQSLFCRVAIEGSAEMVKRWLGHLATIVVRDRDWCNEGWVQNSLSRSLSGANATGKIFLLDRESVIGYSDKTVKADLWGVVQTRVRTFGKKLQEENGWANPSGCGDELDCILWDSGQQELMITEVKNGSNGGGGIYYAPLQVAAYHNAWCDFKNAANAANADQCSLWTGLTAMVRQKQLIGLLPKNDQLKWPDVPKGIGIRPVIVVPKLTRGGQTRSRLRAVHLAVANWCKENEYPSMDNLRIYDWTENRLVDISKDLLSDCK